MEGLAVGKRGFASPTLRTRTSMADLEELIAPAAPLGIAAFRAACLDSLYCTRNSPQDRLRIPKRRFLRLQILLYSKALCAAYTRRQDVVPPCNLRIQTKLIANRIMETTLCEGQGDTLGARNPVRMPRRKGYSRRGYCSSWTAGTLNQRAMYSQRRPRQYAHTPSHGSRRRGC